MRTRRDPTGNGMGGGRHWLAKSLVLAGGLIFLGYAFAAGSQSSQDHQFVYASEAGTVSEFDALIEDVPSTEADLEPQDKDYSRFIHGNAYHSRLPCLLCHRRDDNSARMRYPGKVDHLPCAGCHSLQFSDASSPICTICHTNPQTGATKGFLRLRSFNARFDHSKHRRTNCATCHRPSRGGVARSIPAGASAHTTCFQCHSNRSSLAMTSCSTCHRPGRLSRTPETARSFRVGFSHAKHARDMTCATCHTVRAGSVRGRQVSSPSPAMHFASARAATCAQCHDGQRAFGANDFANCRRCHIGQSFRF